MPTLPLHPAIVHLPLGLAFAIPLVAAGLALAVWRERLPRTAFAVVVGLQALLLAGGVVAMKLGERDEHRVEATVGEPAIHAHEEAAEAFVWTAAGVLVASSALLVVPAAALAATSALVVAGTLAVAGLGARAGHAGGQLVYLHGGAAAYATPVAAVAAPGHDDD